MTTYDYILQEGVTQGISQGISQGIEKGILQEAAEKNRTFTLTLLKETDFSDAKIAMLVGVTVDYVKSIREEMR